MGGGIPLALDIVRFARVHVLEFEALQIGVWCSIIILMGFVSLVTARIRTARDGVQTEHIDWIWTALTWVAIPVGAAVFDVEWTHTLNSAATMDQKATLLAGGFIFLTGIAALVGERAVHRIQCSEIRRTIDDVEQARLAQLEETQ